LTTNSLSSRLISASSSTKTLFIGVSCQTEKDQALVSCSIVRLACMKANGKSIIGMVGEWSDTATEIDTKENLKTTSRTVKASIHG